MSDEQTKDSRTIDHVEDKLPVNILIDLSTLNSAIKDHSSGFTPRLEKSLAKKRREFLIGLSGMVVQKRNL